MFIPPTPSWHELALLALACWAATAAREVKAAEVPVRPAVAASAMIMEPRGLDQGSAGPPPRDCIKVIQLLTCS